MEPIQQRHKYAKKENKIDEAFTCRATILYTHYSACRIGHTDTHTHTHSSTLYSFIFSCCCWRSVPFFILCVQCLCSGLFVVASVVVDVELSLQFCVHIFSLDDAIFNQTGLANIYCPTARICTKTCFFVVVVKDWQNAHANWVPLRKRQILMLGNECHSAINQIDCDQPYQLIGTQIFSAPNLPFYMKKEKNNKQFYDQIFAYFR